MTRHPATSEAIEERRDERAAKSKAQQVRQHVAFSIASRVEAIVSRLDAIASRVEAIASRVDTIVCHRVMLSRC